MPNRNLLSDAARAELDRTLDSLTYRNLERTVVETAVVAVVAFRTARATVQRLTKGSKP